MEDKKEQQQPPIIDQLKEYAETRIKLAKYQAVDSSTAVIGSVIADLAIGICLLLLFVFATITLGFYLSEVLGSNWQGFGCIALVYLIAAIVLKVKRPGIEKAVASGLIKKILN
jgi:hypothetical protein